MTDFQRILINTERWNETEVTPFNAKPHELICTPNILMCLCDMYYGGNDCKVEKFKPHNDFKFRPYNRCYNLDSRNNYPASFKFTTNIAAINWLKMHN